MRIVVLRFILLTMAVIASGDRAFAQVVPSIAPMDPAKRAQFDSLRSQLSAVQQQSEDAWQAAFKKTPILRQAKEARDQDRWGREIEKARPRLIEDRRNFEGSGRGRASLFEHWQDTYGVIVAGTSVLNELVSAPESRPYFAWLAGYISQSLDARSLHPDLERIRDLLPANPKDLSSEKSLELFKALRKREVEALGLNLDIIEKQVKPTEAERQHVKDFERYFLLQGICGLCIEGLKPKELAELDRKEGDVARQLTILGE